MRNSNPRTHDSIRCKPPTNITEYPINPPQSQAIRANGQVFVSGQIPADSSANLVQGNIGELTQACCDNIKAILEAAGSSVSKVVKVNVGHQNHNQG
jgi:enamine deaminase RidA (YjgF/YER057c/UK114 family)